MEELRRIIEDTFQEWKDGCEKNKDPKESKEELLIKLMQWHGSKVKKASSDALSKQNAIELIWSLYEEIKHGDEEHQKWLKDKIVEFLSTRITKA